MPRSRPPIHFGRLPEDLATSIVLCFLTPKGQRYLLLVRKPWSPALPSWDLPFAQEALAHGLQDSTSMNKIAKMGVEAVTAESTRLVAKEAADHAKQLGIEFLPWPEIG